LSRVTGKQVAKTYNKSISGDLISDIRRLIETARQRKNAIALAREMINRFGGLNWLMMATSEDLLGKTPL